MENNKTREVVVEFVGTTTETVKKKIRVDEDVDFENPSQGLKNLLFDEFLRPSDNSGYHKPFQKESIRILQNENLSDYSFEEVRCSGGVKQSPTDDHLVYMKHSRTFDFNNKGMTERYGLVPKMGRWSHLGSWGIKSTLTVGQMETEDYFSLSNENPYFGEYDCNKQKILFTKEKEEIYEMWKNKKFKSMVESQPTEHIRGETEYQFRKLHNLFEKGISNKTMRELGGVFIGILNDVDDFRKYNGTPENSILIGKRLLD